MGSEEVVPDTGHVAVLGTGDVVLFCAVRVSLAATVLLPVSEIDRSLSLPKKCLANGVVRCWIGLASCGWDVVGLAAAKWATMASYTGFARGYNLLCDCARGVECALGLEVFRFLSVVYFGRCAWTLLFVVP